MDIVDQAQATIESYSYRTRDVVETRVSLTNCKECDEAIPEQRRNHGYVELCVLCKTDLEKESRHKYHR